TIEGQEATWTPEPGSGGAAGGVPSFPITGADPTAAAVFVIAPSPAQPGTETAALRLIGLHLRRDPATGAPSIVAAPSRRLPSATPAAAAYQAAAPLQVPLPGGRSGAIRPDLPVFLPGRGQMALFEPMTGELAAFPPESVAAVPVPPGVIGSGPGGN